mmetsp:Transcript_47104/g.109796  ORF Transcript_47104/g.109796 Transcript_47104/m.109796 type:complete len:254 (-) Transcript_47104:287-1048(-)
MVHFQVPQTATLLNRNFRDEAQVLIISHFWMTPACKMCHLLQARQRKPALNTNLLMVRMVRKAYPSQPFGFLELHDFPNACNQGLSTQMQQAFLPARFCQCLNRGSHANQHVLSSCTTHRKELLLVLLHFRVHGGVGSTLGNAITKASTHKLDQIWQLAGWTGSQPLLSGQLLLCNSFILAELLHAPFCDILWTAKLLQSLQVLLCNSGTGGALSRVVMPTCLHTSLVGIQISSSGRQLRTLTCEDSDDPVGI